MTTYKDILFEVKDSVAWMTINRPDDSNMFRTQTCDEMADALRQFRRMDNVGVLVLTGAGDRFFCAGGVKDKFDHVGYGTVLPIVDVYELIDATPKPVIAAVNGFAVGGGNVLHTVCDITVASDRAIFRQVGPSVGSFDAGYGTWFLEDTIGRKRAKEMWFFNRKYTAEQAREMGLVNEVVEHDSLLTRTQELANELLLRGPQALAGLKSAFSARNTGVVGQARMGHDLMLRYYLDTDESAELGDSFRSRRPPDRSKFQH